MVSTAAPLAGSQPEAPVLRILQGEDTSLAACEAADGSAVSQHRLCCIAAGRPGSAPRCPQRPWSQGREDTQIQSYRPLHMYMDIYYKYGWEGGFQTAAVAQLWHLLLAAPVGAASCSVSPRDGHWARVRGH